MIPVHKEIKDLVTKDKFNQGNFGLWFYKFVFLDGNTLKSGVNDVNDYKDQYENLREYNRFLKELIETKHLNQYAFCKSKEKTHKILTFRATLSSPMVTGIGNAHPCEVGMTFDHSLGIPYIPASSIKGIVRFAHTLSLVDEAYGKNIVDEEGWFDDEADWTKIPTIFGTSQDNGRRGKVIFLDAYPEKTPYLHVDIMSPHYGPYYSEFKPPADYYDPTPIKFLTVAKGTTFIFRVLIDKETKDIEQIMHDVSSAVKNSLEKDGVGAKTAVGYGRFTIESNEEPQDLIDAYEEKFLTEEEKLKREIKSFIDKIQVTNDNSSIDSLFQQWENNDKINDNKEIAETFKKKVKKTKANGEFTAHYKKVAEILDINLEESFGKDISEETERQTDNDIENDLKKALRKIKKANGDKKKIKRILKDHKKIKDKILEECPDLNELL
ncbi:CRISPR-associated RAMP protein, Cmr6 family [Flexistipes sinusarabici DSM 4947]|uniref:CRISPR-associated RAMP protein, Cmr6 family n=1 Tax=Flexistipes sinusarabici (strain ATCC 49648 / DSM 4947 / MAS 10) TaxID=717231 RepID=F8E944_FLESM|nr:type III-B CRISPR module RAMP protein Cmr6 [Flexistipes sinusarabici]AEI15246.1 CRISPR-associated RAMP protein, Cmr6 family [Flexistipes sinusarabici DSM 4947]